MAKNFMAKRAEEKCRQEAVAEGSHVMAVIPVDSDGCFCVDVVRLGEILCHARQAG